MPTLKKVAAFCTLIGLVSVLEYFLVYLFYKSVTNHNDMITVELQRGAIGLISRENWKKAKESVEVSVPEPRAITPQIATVISELQNELENISTTSMMYAESDANKSKETELPFTGLKVNDNLERNPYFNDRVRQLMKKYPRQILNAMSLLSCKEPLVECSNRVPRNLTKPEAKGDNIIFTLRTTLHFHDTRLPVLFDTWLTTANGSNVFIMTDGNDKALEETARSKGMHYVISKKSSYQRGDLCCKAGNELEQLFSLGNEHYDWLCHVDDDIYVNLPALVRSLAKFDPKTEPVYFGRSGSEWGKPRRVLPEGRIGKAGQPYHFAVGGMYCLSRPMLEKAKPYLVGCGTFTDSCNKTLEPEDVTVGLVVGVALRQQLQRTERIYTHGLDLPSTVPTFNLAHQIAFSYGFGAVEPWGDYPNIVLVPRPLFTTEEDKSQFRSLHCHIHPMIDWCVKKKERNEAIIERRRQVMRKFQQRLVPPGNGEAGGNHLNKSRSRW